MQVLIHRIDQTAHISLQYQRFQRAKRQNRLSAPYLSARPASSISYIFLRLVALVVTAGPSGAPSVHLCAAGEGVFTDEG